MPKVNILGVKIDKISLDQATDQVVSWLGGKSKHIIVTPNIEFIMKAQTDNRFRKILNDADISIPDSARLGWATNELREKNLVKRIIKWPLFLTPFLFKSELPTTAGVDLMDRLCQLGEEKGFAVGLIGGKAGVAEKTTECLRKKYPKLKISFITSGGQIDNEGNGSTPLTTGTRMIDCDILFVAFGAPKQEKWIAKNMGKIDTKVFMGVGGAFDYLSGVVPRAPGLLRVLGLEWLFRLIIQPWRITRFSSLVKFVLAVLTI